MADKEAMRGQGYKKANFAIRHNTFQSLVRAQVQGNTLGSAYEAMAHAYKAMDMSHEDYVKLVDKATIKAKRDYLDKPFKLYAKAQVKYSQVFEKLEKVKVLKGFEAAKSKVVFGM